MKTRPLEVRFWEKVHKTEDGCWEWSAARNATNYGIIGRRNPRRPDLAHRVSWELHHGPIPDGLFVLHRCDNPPCVNPAHLWLGTLAENNADKMAKGRHRNAPPKTHCPQGHEFTPENTSLAPNGRWRKCRTCHRDRMRGKSSDPDSQKAKSEYNREYRKQWKARDPEGFQRYEYERMKTLKAKDPEAFLERQRAYHKAYYERHKERVQARSREKARVVRARKRAAKD